MRPVEPRMAGAVNISAFGNDATRQIAVYMPRCLALANLDRQALGLVLHFRPRAGRNHAFSILRIADLLFHEILVEQWRWHIDCNGVAKQTTSCDLERILIDVACEDLYLGLSGPLVTSLP